MKFPLCNITAFCTSAFLTAQLWTGAYLESEIGQLGKPKRKKRKKLKLSLHSTIL